MPSLGNTLFHFKYQRGLACEDFDPPVYPSQIEPCEIGIMGQSFKPPCAESGYWEFGFAGGGEPCWEGWWWESVSGKWQYWIYWWIVPLEEWPPEAFFNYSHTDTRRWFRLTNIELVTHDEISAILEIDLDKVDESVFEEDPLNFIEV